MPGCPVSCCDCSENGLVAIWHYSGHIPRWVSILFCLHDVSVSNLAWWQWAKAQARRQLPKVLKPKAKAQAAAPADDVKEVDTEAEVEIEE